MGVYLSSGKGYMDLFLYIMQINFENSEKITWKREISEKWGYQVGMEDGTKRCRIRI